MKKTKCEGLRQACPAAYLRKSKEARVAAAQEVRDTQLAQVRFHRSENECLLLHKVR